MGLPVSYIGKLVKCHMENMGSKNLHEQFRLVGAFCVISPLVSEQIKQYKGADQLPSLSTTMNQFDVISTLIARWAIAFDVYDYMHIKRKHSKYTKTHHGKHASATLPSEFHRAIHVV